MIIKLDDKLNEKYVEIFLNDILSRNKYTVAFNMEKSDANFIFIKDDTFKKYDEVFIISDDIDKDDKICENNELIILDKNINILKQNEDEIFFNYRGFFFLHLRAKSPKKYIKSICIAIEIINALEGRGININEKEIYKSIYNLLFKDN